MGISKVLFFFNYFFFQRYYLENILEPIGFQLRIDLNDNYDYAFRFFISGANNKHTASPESLHSKDTLSKHRSPSSLYLTSKNDRNIKWLYIFHSAAL